MSFIKENVGDSMFFVNNVYVNTYIYHIKHRNEFQYIRKMLIIFIYR